MVDSCINDADNDADNDGICGDADSCQFDSENDSDNDNVCGDVDSCGADAENDADSDALCGGVDSCRYDAENDADSDVVCGDVDECPHDDSADAICNDELATALQVLVGNYSAAEVDVVLAAASTALDGASAEIVEGFLDAIDTIAFNGTSGANGANASSYTSIELIETLDGVLQEVCASVVAAAAAAAAANSSSQAPTTFDQNGFSLSCASPEPTNGSLVVDAGSTQVIAFSAGNGSVVTVSTWNGDGFGNGSTVLVGDVQGISISTADGQGGVQTDDIDGGFQFSVAVSEDTAADTDAGLRKTVSCRFYRASDAANATWVTRGLFLRGIEVNGDPSGTGIDVSAICVSTHLTMFTVTDDSEEVTAVESKMQVFASRFAAMASVDLANTASQFNALATGIFVSMTGVFVLVVLVGKNIQRKGAIDEARVVFAQNGRLNRPAVISGDEFEAILRGWLRPGQVMGLMALQILSVNPFAGLLFTWSHERIVFTTTDKAYIL